MMYLAACTFLVILGSISAQTQPSDTIFHGRICHSNHLQQTEDQVIENVVNAMDSNANDHISKDEVLIFFADLMGIHLGSLAQTLTSLPHTELIDLASGFSIEKEAFVHAWHTRFHDSKAFIRGTFDIFDVSKDGVVSAAEIEGLVSLALLHGDIDGDRHLEKAEMVRFLEKIYKNC